MSIFRKICALVLSIIAVTVFVDSCPIIAGVVFERQTEAVYIRIIDVYLLDDVNPVDYEFDLCNENGNNCVGAPMSDENEVLSKDTYAHVQDTAKDNSFFEGFGDAVVVPFSQEYLDTISGASLIAFFAGTFSNARFTLEVREKTSQKVVDRFTMDALGLNTPTDSTYYAWRHRNDNIPPTGIDNIVSVDQTTTFFYASSSANTDNFMYPYQVSFDDPTAAANACGDPHFSTWGDIHYDFHGACDLILINAPYYGGGRGLSVYVRTQISSWFSYISNVVVKIGTDTLEMSLSNEIFVNSIKVDTLPRLFSREETKEESGTLDNIHHYHKYEFFLTQNQILEVTSLTNVGGDGMFFINMKNVQQDADDFAHSVGLMGDFRTGDLVSKDGTKVLSTDMMSLNDIVESWQVTDSELYFHDKSHTPIYPEKCVYPKSDESLEKHLIDDEDLKNKAEESCARWGAGASKCMYDVLRTRDISYAIYGTY